jgi:hypothetical protein
MLGVLLYSGGPAEAQLITVAISGQVMTYNLMILYILNLLKNVLYKAFLLLKFL